MTAVQVRMEWGWKKLLRGWVEIEWNFCDDGWDGSWNRLDGDAWGWKCSLRGGVGLGVIFVPVQASSL